MASQVFSVASPTPTVVVDTRGDLFVLGWDEPRVVVDYDEPGEAVMVEAAVKVRARGDCRVSMPRGGALFVERADGDARIERVTGGVQARGVGANLSIRESGSVIVEAVGDSLEARGVVGALAARSVGGSVDALRVSGDLAVTAVGGSVRAREIGGRFIGESIGGSLQTPDVELGSSLSIGGSGEFRLNPAAGQNLKINAGGSLSCRFADSASATLRIADGRGARTVTLGAGAADVSLSAGGGVEIRNKAFESAGPGRAPEVDFDRMFGQLEDAFVSMGASFDRFGEGLGHLGSLGERIADRARRAAGRAAERARRRAEREAARSQRTSERERERASRRGPAFGEAWPSPGTPPSPPHSGPVQPADAAPPSEPVSDEERLTILRMVEQKKITIEQAEQLLRALDG